MTGKICFLWEMFNYNIFFIFFVLTVTLTSNRLHNQAGANIKIAATIDSLIAKKDEADDKA